MFESIETFRIAHKMAVHAGQRQAVIAQNVANADTPGYSAKDIPDFKTVVNPKDGSVQRATRQQHLHGQIAGSGVFAVSPVKAMHSPDGNSVSVETEMLKAVEVKRQHDRALAIYKSGLDVLRQTLRSQ